MLFVMVLHCILLKIEVVYIYMHFLLHQIAFRIKLPGNFDQKINFPTYQTKVFNATDEKWYKK